MDLDPGLALGAVFTAAGAPIWGAAIQGVIQILKAVPQFEGVLNGYEKLLCFVLAGLLTVAAFYAGMTATPPERTLDVGGMLVAVLAWFTVARMAMAAYDDFIARAKAEDPEPTGARIDESVLSAKGWNGQ